MTPYTLRQLQEWGYDLSRVPHTIVGDRPDIDIRSKEWLAERDRVRDARLAKPLTPAPQRATGKPRDMSCVHRGDEIDRRACLEGCGKGTLLKVFACGLHTACTVGKSAGVKVCARCADRTPPAA
jgi:hypothetical protein